MAKSHNGGTRIHRLVRDPYPRRLGAGRNGTESVAIDPGGTTTILRKRIGNRETYPRVSTIRRGDGRLLQDADAFCIGGRYRRRPYHARASSIGPDGNTEKQFCKKKKHANAITDAVFSDHGRRPPRLMATSLLNRLRGDPVVGGGGGGGVRVRGPNGPPVVLPPPPPPPPGDRSLPPPPRPIATDRARTAGRPLSRFHDARACTIRRHARRLPPSGGGDHIVVSCASLVCYMIVFPRRSKNRNVRPVTWSFPATRKTIDRPPRRPSPRIRSESQPFQKTRKNIDREGWPLNIVEETFFVIVVYIYIFFFCYIKIVVTLSSYVE